MPLSENQLFHGRYRLVELIGRGASAQVWKAIDTKAGNMPVALKIYKPEVLGAGSAGVAEFQREFTMVYNMTHTNLLHPQGFDISDGSPYLVMAFCENGPATSMVGRCEKDDILRLLRDVAAGLEYLHDHNIIHQDIKPDNILLDDNCNFLVTDFGISRRDQNDAIGGTRAYMAPEVYRGQPTQASDIWSLGATAVELINGQPPYGELGGAAQTQNQAMPQLKGKLGEGLPKLINQMLDPDPRKRPSASTIRAKIDHYRETGSWNQKSNRNKIAYIAAGIFSLLIVAGLVIWDANRTKVRYYKDYTTVWGVPQGFGPVSPFDQKHRENTFKFEYKRGKLVHLTRVNGHGYVTSSNDSEFNERYTEAEFYYNSDDQIDYIRVFNQGGECEYVMDFDNNLRTATFKSDDEHQMEKPLLGATSETSIAINDNEKNASPITRYLIDYDDKGRYEKIAYATFKNIKVTDEDMIHGKLFEYDDRGRISKMTTIGIDGEPRGNSRGLAIREYTWDDDDNLHSVNYLAVDGAPSDDGSGCPRFELKFDKYGNKVEEGYFNLDGDPMLRTSQDLNIHGVKYERDNYGNVITMQFTGLDDEPTTLPNGIMSIRKKYDNRGYLTEQANYDEDGELFNAVDEIDESAELYAIQEVQCNDRGILTYCRFLDADREPINLSYGYNGIKHDLDDVGRTTMTSYLDKDSALVNHGKFYYAQTKYSYDNMGQLTRIENFDSDGKPVNNDYGVATIELEYDDNCFLTKQSYFGKDGKPCQSNALYSYATFTYDTSRGNRTSVSYFDTKGNKTGGDDGIHRIEYVHDPATNACTAVKYFNASDKLDKMDEYKYDSRGNVVERREVGENGALINGTVVTHSEYDSNNRPIKEWYTNAAGQKVNIPDNTYSEVVTKRDQYGNIIELTCFSTIGKPATNKDGVAKMVFEYDKRNKPIRLLNYDAQGSPVKNAADFPPEKKFEYDERGNNTVEAVFDGNGHPYNSADNWQKKVRKFDQRNRIVEQATFDKEGKPVKPKGEDYTRITLEYNAHNFYTKREFFDNDKLVVVINNKYNSHDKPTEESYADASGKKPKDYLISKVVYEYESDEVTPKKETYYDGSKTFAWRTWNKDKGKWNDMQFAQGYGNYQASYNPNPVSSNWQSVYRELAADCPYDLGGGEMQVYSISVGGDYLSITIKLLNESKYELTDAELADYRTRMNGLRKELKGELPSYVDVYVYLIDRAGRRIDF